MNIMLMPKISIVTTNYNGAAFLEETIQSVLNQNYPNLEYIIVDGGSTDESISIINKYKDKLAWWISEPDKGMYEAIQKGFEHCTGDIMAWINSDDKYLPWTFSIVAEIFNKFNEVRWLTSANGITWDKFGRAVNIDNRGGFSGKAFSRGLNLTGKNWHSTYFIQQETTFWRRDLWEQAGGKIDISLKLAGDFDLWAKFFRFAELYTVCTTLGGMRAHETQKSALYFNEYINEATTILQNNGTHTYGKIGSLIRRVLYITLGRNFIPANRLSMSINKILSLSLLYKVNRCVWKKNEWSIISGYII